MPPVKAKPDFNKLKTRTTGSFKRKRNKSKNSWKPFLFFSASVGLATEGILDMNQDIVGLTWSLIAEIARSKTRASLSILAQVESARPVKDAKITFDKLLLQFVVGKIRLLKKGDSKEQSTLALDVAKELLKASLKAVLSMMAVPEVRQCRKFMHAAGRVQSTVSLEPLFEEVKMQMRKEAE